MNLPEAFARAAALRAQADRADREIGDYISAELDALPVKWLGPVYDFCNMVTREGFALSSGVQIFVHVADDGVWRFCTRLGTDGSGATAAEALADALRKHRIA